MSEVDKKRRAVQTQADWERVLSASAHRQQIVPDAVLVGGSAAAIHADHRFSYDDDHVVVHLKERYARILERLEQESGWVTNRLKPPVMILGDLDGVETGIRNLIRKEPLEVTTYDTPAGVITLPTLHEIARIKAYLIVSRNATRDYVDFVALAHKISTTEGEPNVVKALRSLDRLYPQPNHSSVLIQLAKQLSEPRPKDFGKGDLSVYRMIDDRWKEWDGVKTAAQHYGVVVMKAYDVTQVRNVEDSRFEEP